MTNKRVTLLQISNDVSAVTQTNYPEMVSTQPIFGDNAMLFKILSISSTFIQGEHNMNVNNRACEDLYNDLRSVSLKPTAIIYDPISAPTRAKERRSARSLCWNRSQPRDTATGLAQRGENRPINTAGEARGSRPRPRGLDLHLDSTKAVSTIALVMTDSPRTNQ